METGRCAIQNIKIDENNGMKSMTGYALQEIRYGNYHISLEMRSYNNKYMDIALDIPTNLYVIEQTLRKTVTDVIKRGNVFVKIAYTNNESKNSILDEGVIARIFKELNHTAHALGIKGVQLLSDIAPWYRHNMEYAPSFDANIHKKIITLLKKALQELIQVKSNEGKSIQDDLLKQVATVAQQHEKIVTMTTDVARTSLTKFQNNYRLLFGRPISKTDINTEIASEIMKHTINEEVVRLAEHIDIFKKTCTEKVVGKKLDFIAQEMLRETNTIASKSSTKNIAKCVILIKEAIENIRENVRNVE